MMKRTFVLLSLVVSFFTSGALADAQSCKPVVPYHNNIVLSCVSFDQGQAYYYAIEIIQQTSPLICHNVFSVYKAQVNISNDRGHLLRSFQLNEGQYVYNLGKADGTGAYFASLYGQLSLFECIVYQGGGNGGISVGN